MLDMLEGVGQEQHCTEMLKYIKTHSMVKPQVQDLVYKQTYYLYYTFVNLVNIWLVIPELLWISQLKWN